MLVADNPEADVPTLAMPRRRPHEPPIGLTPPGESGGSVLCLTQLGEGLAVIVVKRLGNGRGQVVEELVRAGSC